MLSPTTARAVLLPSPTASAYLTSPRDLLHCADPSLIMAFRLTSPTDDDAALRRHATRPPSAATFSPSCNPTPRVWPDPSMGGLEPCVKVPDPLPPCQSSSPSPLAAMVTIAVHCGALPVPREGFAGEVAPLPPSRLAVGFFASELWRRRGRGGVRGTARVSPPSRPRADDAEEGVVFLRRNCLPPGLLFRF